jgi:hypothetical protein
MRATERTDDMICSVPLHCDDQNFSAGMPAQEIACGTV